MRGTPRQKAIAWFVAMVVAAALLLRAKEEGWVGDGPATVGEASRFCVGVSHPRIERALVCVESRSRVFEEAVRRFRLPEECGGLEVPEELRAGDLLVFDELPRKPCVLVDVERLPGGLRTVAGGLFDPNSDSSADLRYLPRIGEVKAQRIVDSRAEDGPFTVPEDLLRVKGVGPKTLERLIEWIDLGPKSGLTSQAGEESIE